jgi:multicomponent Na+:H+ antiporter subunit C
MSIDAWLPYLLCLGLFLIGMFAVFAKKNLIKIIVGLAISEYAANLFLILVGYRIGGRAPIFSPSESIDPGAMVDPLPQALVLTSIVIGLAITAFLVAIAMRLREKYGTFDITKIRELRG